MTDNYQAAVDCSAPNRQRTMSYTVTLLRAVSGQTLAKTWQPDGSIVPAARVKWFKGIELTIASVPGICRLLDEIEGKPCIALVKERLTPGVDIDRLRRKCEGGIDERTGEPFVAGLVVVPLTFIALDIEGIQRPASIDSRDGDALARYARDRLPEAFRGIGCVWQFSGSSGHPSKLGDIRLHLFFDLDAAVFPSAWKRFFANLKFVDRSVFDKGKLIFTAAPVIHGGSDPITRRHGLLKGEPTVVVPNAVVEQSARIASGADKIERPALSVPPAPMPEAASAFVEIIAESNILRSHHEAYRNDRTRRLAFCVILKGAFGVVDEAALAQAFWSACVGDTDANGAHDAQQAVEWARTASPNGRQFSVRKLLCDASVALHAAGRAEMAGRAARLAMVFLRLETTAAKLALDGGVR